MANRVNAPMSRRKLTMFNPCKVSTSYPSPTNPLLKTDLPAQKSPPNWTRSPQKSP